MKQSEYAVRMAELRAANTDLSAKLMASEREREAFKLVAQRLLDILLAVSKALEARL